MPSAYIDPAHLAGSPSPSSSSSGSPPPAPAPSRKRPRSDMSAEERREARAHRNRIAAQNSRDRRKVQFASLSTKVAELEEENKQLKDELSKYRSQQQPVPQIVPTFTDTTRERENEELRERVRSLERSWETVVRMLAAQGKPTPAALPSPPVSNSSDSDASPLFPHASPTLSLLSADATQDELTRHSARVATAGTPSPVSTAALQRVESADLNVEDWFMDLISSSPAEASFPAGAAGAVSGAAQDSAAAGVATAAQSLTAFDWECGAADADMQQLLSLLPPPDAVRDELAGLGLDLGASATSASDAWAWTGTEASMVTAV
ncbi:hypothetical protein AURDEDRAFT_120387 [Auricularia subglabra TFB-10046 SS5]|nr:hypothetical protein AURDEDRAFT_120387 [Auricularia subglabra TFB-10046 SS5]